MVKKRIDILLVDRGLAPTRAKAQALIMAGTVLVDGQPATKPGKMVDEGAEVLVKEKLPYVSRGGLKLEGALKEFDIDVTGLVALDVGSSTGGFTDCLLQRSAKRVHAVDVGKGLIDWKLRNDSRVHIIEGRNIRELQEDELGEKVDIAVIDVSFISLKKVLPVVVRFLKSCGTILALVKPQFEVGKGEVGKGGIVRDVEKQRRVVEELKEFARSMGLEVKGECTSPIKGAKGNREFWLYLSMDGKIS